MELDASVSLRLECLKLARTGAPHIAPAEILEQAALYEEWCLAKQQTAKPQQRAARSKKRPNRKAAPLTE